MILRLRFAELAAAVTVELAMLAINFVDNIS